MQNNTNIGVACGHRNDTLSQEDIEKAMEHNSTPSIDAITIGKSLREEILATSKVYSGSMYEVSLLDTKLVKFVYKLKKDLANAYEKNDPEHGFKHVEYVCMLALRINRKLKLGINPYMIILPALAHDMYSYVNRKEHHHLASLWIAHHSKDYHRDFTSNCVYKMSRAAAEHRASYEGEYSSMLSELISAADRGEPSFEHIARRVYNCSIAPGTVVNTNETKTDKSVSPMMRLVGEESIVRTLDHIKDKYSRHGYARYNDLYMKAFKDELLEM